MQLARAVRDRTPPTWRGVLAGVMRDLLADGNTVGLVDHDTNVLKEADGLSRWGRMPAQAAAR